MQYYSQNGQDAFIVKLFNGKRNGYFLDIGAYDGVYFSNSLTLEKSLGWEGICIEPNPLVYGQLKSNRTCTCLNYCVSDKKRVVDFLAVSGWGAMLSGILDKFNEGHLARIDDTIKEHGGSKQVIQVEALPISDLLENYGVKTVDYCNIDVEGGEMSVLRSINFSHVEIKIFTIENNYGSETVMQFLKGLGYSLIARIGEDEVYEYKSKRYSLISRMKIYKIKNSLGNIKRKLIRK